MKGKQILILVMFLLLCSFASASYDNYFIEDGISAWYLNDTEHQSFSESSTLRFSDTFTGTNGDPISTTNWDTYYTGGTSQLTEINSNAMRTTVTPPCGYTRLAVTQSDNAYSITEELVFNFSIKRNSDLDNEQVIYIQDTHLSSGTYETGKYTGIRATSAGTYELINVNASSSVNVLETISSTTTSFNDFQLRINILQQTYTLYLNGDFIGSDNIYFPANNYYITLAVSNYDCNFGRYGYFDDIYLYDNNLTLNVKDYIGTNDGTLHGKIFNHGTITGATLNNNLTGAITGATWNTSCSLPDGSIGNCLEFDGGNNKLTLDSSLTNNEDSSFCSWIYLNDIGGADSGRIFDDGKFLIWYQSSTDKLLTSNDGDSTYIRSSAISSNSWNYICVIRESTSTSTFYINGISDTSGNTGTIQSGTTNSVLGNRNSGDRGWAGSIKDVKILDKALTSDEVLDLYNSGVANYSGYAHEINFPLNEGTGTEVYTKEGKFGGYYDFDGVDDIITATGHGFTSADTFTISAWIKPSLTEISGGIVTEYDPANTGWDLDLSSGYIIMNLRGSSSLSSGAVGPDLRDGVWHYVSSVISNTTILMYVDGVLVSTTNGNWVSSVTNQPLWIGARYHTNPAGYYPFNGSIGEVQIHNRRLSQPEIVEEMNSNAVTNPEGIVGYYDFNELSGAIVYDNNQLSTGPRQNISSPEDPVFSWDKAINFDGVDDIITATGHGFTSADTFTISTWIKPSLTEISGGIVTEYDPANTGWDLDLSSGQIIMDLRGTSILSSGAVGPDLRDGVWHYVSSVVSNTTILMYVDGVLVSTTNGNWVSSVTNQPLWIGARYHPSPAGYYPFNGSIADVRIYNRSLTDSEIQTLYYGLQDINIVTDTIGSTTNNYYWNIESIYGSPYTTRNNASLDVPVGNFTFNLTNDLGFYNLTNYVLEITPTTSEYVLPIYNSVLNLTLFDVLANETKENITVDVTYSDSSTAQYLGDGTLIQIPNKKGQEMNVAWTSQDSISDGNFDYTTENMSENYTYDVYSSNSVRIYLYDIATGSLINENITLTITNLNESYINTQTINGGSFNLSGLEPDTYSITASGENFSRQVYPITVTAFSTQELNIFLTKTTEETIFTIKEASTKNVIEGATVTIKQIVNNTWTIISVLNSDITGRVIFGYNSDVHYSYIISADGYTLKTFDLNPIIFTSYNVWLEKSSAEDTTGDLKNIQVVYSPSKYFNGAINNVSLDFISPYGEFTNFGYTITSQGDTFINSSNNAYGGTLTTGLLIENASIGSIVSINYYYTKSNGVSQSYTVNFLVENTTSGINAKIGDTYGMNILERIIVYLIIMLVVAGAGAIYGGSIGASVVSLFVAGYFMHIEFLPIWLIAPSMVFMGFLTLGGKK